MARCLVRQLFNNAHPFRSLAQEMTENAERGRDNAGCNVASYSAVKSNATSGTGAPSVSQTKVSPAQRKLEDLTALFNEASAEIPRDYRRLQSLNAKVEAASKKCSNQGPITG